MIHKIVVATDSFKESVSAIEACKAIRQGLQDGFSRKLEILSLPMADGGEGLSEVLIDSYKAKKETCEVEDAYGKRIETTYGYHVEQKIAIIESALVCGLEGTSLAQRNPVYASSIGLGQLIKEVVTSKQIKKMIIGLGGSATNDGGIGMLSSLGAKYYDQDGEEIIASVATIHKVKRMDLTQAVEIVKDIELIVASDVDNPFVGQNGATFTFGKQKGASKEQLLFLENQLQHMHTLIKEQYNIELSNLSKTGAAGGIGGALYVIGATLVSGIELVLKETNFEQQIKDSNLIITGEGSIDIQTSNGKTISGIAKIAKTHNIPVIALGGRVTRDIDALYDMGITSVFSITNEAKSLKQALLDGKECLYQTSYNLAKLLDVGI